MDFPRYVLYADGSSLGNPGPSGCGAVLFDGDGAPRERMGSYLGIGTSNVAEWEGLILGASRALALGVRNLDIRLDSQLVARQISGRYKVRAPHLMAYCQKAKELLASFENWSVSHVRREFNREADRLAGIAASLGKAGVLGKGDALPPAAMEAPERGGEDGVIF
ncbi:MAG: ribonuclease HI family protein [Deltaproteobacteria bacterium]|jgi:ribonuclease HI|nr:ribonuclease HI family protein [Deltaproteobacteria bacterium]